MARYIKALNLWDQSISGLIDQGLIKVQSGQAAYCGYRSSPCVIDEIKKGYVRAFHAPTMKEARSKYMDYKKMIKLREQRKAVLKQIKDLENELNTINHKLMF